MINGNVVNNDWCKIEVQKKKPTTVIVMVRMVTFIEYALNGFCTYLLLSKSLIAWYTAMITNAMVKMMVKTLILHSSHLSNS